MEQGIVDIHAHILPSIDDGAKDWEEAGKMLDTAITQGIRTIIATPHYSRRVSPERIRELVRMLTKEARRICPEFMIYPGQEILYFDSMTEALKNGEALTLADSRYVLTEFMPTTPYQKMYQGVRKIQQAGYYPVIAHVERYEALRKIESFQELREMGCLMQMNYQSLQGSAFDKNVRWCRKQVQQEQIHVLGTDMHHSVHRAPLVDKSLDWLSGHVEQKYIAALTYGQGMKIIDSTV